MYKKKDTWDIFLSHVPYLIYDLETLYDLNTLFFAQFQTHLLQLELLDFA